MKNNIKYSICKGNLVPFGFESNDIIIWETIRNLLIMKIE